MIAALAVVVAWSAGQEKLSLPLASARDRTGEGIAFVEVRTPRAQAFVGETVGVVVSFGLETGFAEREIVQPFGVRLDVPVQLAAAWLVARPMGAAEAGSTFALDDGVQRAVLAEDRVIDGRHFRVHAIEGAVLATSPGKLDLPAPTLAFAYATKFEESSLFGRTPVDRVDAYVRGEPLALDVVPLPEAGRPPEFTGAVGTFTVRATVDTPEIEMGETLRLHLAVRGDGDLGGFSAPSWKELGGFRVVGTTDEKSPTVRTFTYALAPLSEKAWQIPEIAFATFDPEPPAGYRVVRTDPIVVVVRPRTVAPVPQDPEGGARVWPWAAAVGALALAVFVAVRRR